MATAVGRGIPLTRRMPSSNRARWSSSALRCRRSFRPPTYRPLHRRQRRARGPILPFLTHRRSRHAGWHKSTQTPHALSTPTILRTAAAAASHRAASAAFVAQATLARHRQPAASCVCFQLRTTRSNCSRVKRQLVAATAHSHRPSCSRRMRHKPTARISRATCACDSNATLHQ